MTQCNSLSLACMYILMLVGQIANQQKWQNHQPASCCFCHIGHLLPHLRLKDICCLRCWFRAKCILPDAAEAVNAAGCGV